MLVATRAIVLHAFDYLETSRVLRLVTRDAGIQSVLAKGARRSRGKFGSGLDLFAEGDAELYLKASRELQTMASFDVMRSRAALALDMDRFLAASALAEMVLRLGSGEANAALYDAVAMTLDALADAQGTAIAGVGLGGLWQIIAAAGFAPVLDNCASCHAPLDAEARAVFSPASGGTLCDRCARLTPGGRALPAEARAVIVDWLAGEPRTIDLPSIKAHQRLLREFVTEHLQDARAWRAFAAWETGVSLGV